MRTRLILLGLVCLVLAAAGLQAQAKPDFSGVWTLVADKSDFGPMPAPTTLTRTITHADPSLKVVITQTGAMGDTTTTLTFSTDGKPHTNTVSGSEMTSTAKWDGAAIVMSSSVSLQGTDVKIEDRYELSDAGKTLTLTRRYATAEGEATAKVVMTKTK